MLIFLVRYSETIWQTQIDKSITTGAACNKDCSNNPRKHKKVGSRRGQEETVMMI
jgi:hypothetical protein